MTFWFSISVNLNSQSRAMSVFSFDLSQLITTSIFLMSSPKWFVNWLNTGEVVAILF